MTPTEYQRLAARTINNDLTESEQIRHSLLGMCSELGEIQGIYQKKYQGHSVSPAHLKKELGDLLWFAAEYCTANGWTLEDVMATNIKKLEARYPDGFEEERSRNRKEGDL